MQRSRKGKRWSQSRSITLTQYFTGTATTVEVETTGRPSVFYEKLAQLTQQSTVAIQLVGNLIELVEMPNANDTRIVPR